MSQSMGVPFLNLGTAGIINVAAVKRIKFTQGEIILGTTQESAFLNCVISYVDGENQELDHQESVVLYNYFAVQGFWGADIAQAVEREIAAAEMAARPRAAMEPH